MKQFVLKETDKLDFIYITFIHFTAEEKCFFEEN